MSLEPLYKGGLEGVTAGSSCIANAYSNNHDKIAAKETGILKRTALHVVDALALVHALILRLQALVFPFKPSCSADIDLAASERSYNQSRLSLGGPHADYASA